MILDKVIFLKIKVHYYLEMKYITKVKFCLMIYQKTKNPFLVCHKSNSLN